jgi:hypothetical protein
MQYSELLSVQISGTVVITCSYGFKSPTNPITNQSSVSSHVTLYSLWQVEWPLLMLVLFFEWWHPVEVNCTANISEILGLSPYSRWCNKLLALDDTYKYTSAVRFLCSGLCRIFFSSDKSLIQVERTSFGVKDKTLYPASHCGGPGSTTEQSICGLW